MNASTAPAGVSSPVLGTCPGCGGHEFLLMKTDDATNFLCSGCERCWHHSLGWIMRADPAACLSCPRKVRCSRLFAEEPRTR